MHIVTALFALFVSFTAMPLAVLGIGLATYIAGRLILLNKVEPSERISRRSLAGVALVIASGFLIIGAIKPEPYRYTLLSHENFGVVIAAIFLLTLLGAWSIARGASKLFMMPYNMLAATLAFIVPESPHVIVMTLPFLALAFAATLPIFYNNMTSADPVDVRIATIVLPYLTFEIVMMRLIGLYT